ncbi:zinc dependent phospholipase C family protein [Halanaerobium sp. Z-7514]|uniref:Zinc dependent phospholipase C family protein n=1 Tax=Halanaerobium polyolivorans TaxID=2886943 RepID=A0AAW4WTD9_9FIRM|nr:zinc dependent phospholipase C family protein [Halanaerobium polyolivorans]MCC3144355.1 zinc dependent phospholipase C family protein [Halanaerobium polyolivorans]
MPDFWTHILAGEKVLKSCENEELSNLIAENYQLYNFGCQGADILFYKDFWPWKRSKNSSQAASFIHRISAKDIFAIILKDLDQSEIYKDGKIIAGAEKRGLLTYLLAFIVHYSLDSISHPFILANGGAGQKHKLIEIKIDIYMIDKYWNKDVLELNPQSYYQLKAEFKEEIERFYANIFSELLPYPYKAGMIEGAYTDLKKYHSLFCDNKQYKYYFFKLLNYLYPDELASYSYQLAKDKEIWSAENYQQFENYFAQSLNKSREYFTLLFNYFKKEISLKETLSAFSSRDFLGQNKAKNSL